MARIVPDSVFRRGYRQTQYKRSPGQRTADQWTSPSGVATAWKLTDSVGGVINAAVQKKKAANKILSEVQSTGEMVQLARAAEAAAKGDPAVSKLQKRLIEAGFELPKSMLPTGELDATMGPETRTAIRKYKARQKGRLGLTPEQMAQYATLQERAGGPLDRLVAGAGNLFGHDASEIEHRRRQAALARAEAIEEQALAQQSAARGYELAAGAETMAQRKEATDESLAAYDRMRAATLSGQAAGQGQAAITQNLQRLFPGRKPQRAIRQVRGGPAPKLVKKPKPLFDAMHKSQSANYINAASALRANPNDTNFVAPLSTNDVVGTTIKPGTLALQPTEKQKARMKLGQEEAAFVLQERVLGYQQVMNASKHKNFPLLLKLVRRARANSGAALQRSNYANVNDQLFQMQVSDPFSVVMASGRSIDDMLNALNDPAFVKRMQWKDFSRGMPTEAAGGGGASGGGGTGEIEEDESDAVSNEIEQQSTLGKVVGSLGDLMRKARAKAKEAEEKKEEAEVDPPRKPVARRKRKPSPGSAEEAAALKDYDPGTKSKRQLEEEKKRKKQRRARRRRRKINLDLEGDTQTKEQRLAQQNRRLAATRARPVSPVEQERSTGSAAERKARTAEANKMEKLDRRRSKVAKQVRSLMGRLPATSFNRRTKEGRAKIRKFKRWATKTLMANNDASTFNKVKTAATQGRFQ